MQVQDNYVVDETVRVQDLQRRRRKQKMIFSAILIVACLGFLAFLVFKNKFDFFGLVGMGSDNKKKEYLLNNNPNNPESPSLSEDELFKLAVDARNAGLIVQGVMQCGWTRKQLDLFGPPGSKPRTEFEKIYVECVSRDVCQDVRGFPTWARGKLQFPGFRDAERIRELIAETKNLPVQQQVMGASLPLEENIPDAKHAAPGPKSSNEQKIRADERIQEIQDEEDSEEEKPAAKSGAKSGTKSDAKSDSEPDTEPDASPVKVNAKAKNEAGEPRKKKMKKKENVRGVSAYPPLNVPNMPGAHVMAIDTSYTENQMRQGNIPRESVGDPEPVQAIVDQIAATFEPGADNAARDPDASLFSHARLPHSASITTGNPMESKQIYVEKNT